MSLVTCIAIVLGIFLLFYLAWRKVFPCKGYKMKDVIWAGSDLNIQLLKRGTSKTLIVLGNGWNVSLNAKSQIIKHDPVFLMPNEELQLLEKGKEDYEVIFTFFPFECRGIDQAAQELADFLNNSYKGYNIFFIGHSKSAIHFVQTLNYLERRGREVKLLLVSPTFGGVYHDKYIMSILNTLDKIIYRLIFTPHKVNEDITKGAEFLRKVFRFDALSQYEKYLVRSKVEYVKGDIINNFLYHLDTSLSIKGDGIIGYDEQFCDTNWKQEFTVISAHSNSLPKAIEKLEDISVL